MEVNKHHLLTRSFVHSDVSTSLQGSEEATNINNDANANMIKRYLVYMELPIIKIGDYHKPSCVVGHILRFHFLMKIAEDERVPLKLLPIRAYKVPVVNVAVIHRPFIEDDVAKGPIPKSPGVKSPLIKYTQDEVVESEAKLEEDFARGSALDGRGKEEQEEPSGAFIEVEAADAQQRTQRDSGKHRGKEEQEEPSGASIEVAAADAQQRTQRDSDKHRGKEEQEEPSGAPIEVEAADTQQRTQRDSGKHRGKEEQEEPSGAPTEVEAADAQQRTQRDSGKHRGKKRKKYFVYCELPKVALGDYRISSVTSSELIHCHFLMKIAKDEARGQPVLQPIKKYRRPRVNFAVIHRSLIVDDEAMGPIPRSPGVKSPMIREDMDGDDDVDVLHATMGFNYGAAVPRSKYELLTQWSLVADDRGRVVPELVLSKALDS